MKKSYISVSLTSPTLKNLQFFICDASIDPYVPFPEPGAPIKDIIDVLKCCAIISEVWMMVVVLR
jgi:hypothetical protein